MFPLPSPALRCRVLQVLALTACAIVLAATRPTFAADEWPQWRGPDGQGHAPRAAGLPLRWSETENVAWKTEIPGRGWSSPVVSGDRLWMTTALVAPPAGGLRLRAVCLDRATGRLLHDVELLAEDRPGALHALNSHASPSPVFEQDVLYCHFGTYGTVALDVRGPRVLWSQRGLRLNHENGPGSTPVLWGNLLLFHGDGSDVQFLAALDKRTGDVAWKTERSGTLRPDKQQKKAYGTPLVVDVGGRPVLVSPAADWVYGYDPATGRELWKLPYGSLGFSTVPRPVAGHGLVYFCTGFMQSELLALRPDPRDPAALPEVVWRFKKQMPTIPSPLLVGNEILAVSDKGVATCLDALNGELLWTERLGGNFCSSPLLADGRIFVSNREGQTYVLAPGRKYELLAENVLETGCMASPLALDRALYLRTEKHVYRIETPQKK